MSIIINGFGLDPASATPALTPNPSATSPSASARPVTDTVEFSPAARALADGVGQSSFRTARVQAIRAEITAGTYETQARIDGVVSRLLDAAFVGSEAAPVPQVIYVATRG